MFVGICWMASPSRMTLGFSRDNSVQLTNSDSEGFGTTSYPGTPLFIFPETGDCPLSTLQAAKLQEREADAGRKVCCAALGRTGGRGVKAPHFTQVFVEKNVAFWNSNNLPKRFKHRRDEYLFKVVVYSSWSLGKLT